jgi:hypothetical protein
MIDPDKTQKITTIRRSIPRAELYARVMADLHHLEKQAEIVRGRLREIEQEIAA